MDSVIAANFIAKCPSCGKLYEVIVSLDKKMTDQNGNPDYKVICCALCRQHPVLTWLSPYDIRSVTKIAQLPTSEGDDNQPE